MRVRDVVIIRLGNFSYSVTEIAVNADVASLENFSRIYR